MGAGEPLGGLRSARLIVLGLVIVILVLGLALIALTVGRSIEERGEQPAAPGQVDALATSSDPCVTCHRKATPGIVDEFGHSAMAAAKVGCRDCHQVEASYPGATEHEGDFVLASPTPAKCERCHGPHGTSDSLRPFEENRISGYSRDIWGRSISRARNQPGAGMKMDDCARCHKEQGVSTGCLDCHK